MNGLESLIRAERFFLNVRRRWKLGIVMLLLAAGGLVSLKFVENSFAYNLISVVTAVALLFVALWISSYIIIPRLKKRRAKIYTDGLNAGNKPKEKLSVSSSRMLTLSARIRAWLNLHELKDTSDYCFMDSEVSYIRVQWFKPECKPRSYSMDSIKVWSDNGIKPIVIKFNNEECILQVHRDFDEEGLEYALARWFPKNATEDEVRGAETIELIQNEPFVLSYEMCYEQPNGELYPQEEPICAITWIGGNK